MKTTDQYRAFQVFLGGFTLLELLIVISIIIVMTAFVTPSVSTVVRGSNLDRAGMSVTDQIALARQEAVSMNREVQVRFFEKTEGAQSAVRGIQLWRIDEGKNGPEKKALTRIIWFAEQIEVKMNETLSPLLWDAKGQMNNGNIDYLGFRIRANGTLDCAPERAFITIQNMNDSAVPPKNFYTIRINPFNARATIYRP